MRHRRVDVEVCESDVGQGVIGQQARGNIQLLRIMVLPVVFQSQLSKRAVVREIVVQFSFDCHVDTDFQFA